MLHTKYQSAMLSSFREEDIKRFCHFFFPFGCHGNHLWKELNFLNNFCTASPKEHLCQVSSRLAQWFRRSRCFKKLLTDDGRQTPDAGQRAITIAHSEHFVLRWAKKVVPKLLQEVKVTVDIITSDDIKIDYTGKFQGFTARYIITRRPWWSYIAHLNTKQYRLTRKINTK